MSHHSFSGKITAPRTLTLIADEPFEEDGDYRSSLERLSMTDDSKLTFRLIRMPNGKIKLEWGDNRISAAQLLNQESSATLIRHIEQGLQVSGYADYLMFPKTWGIRMFDALTITSDENGVVCIMIGSSCSPKTASLFVTAASWIHSTSFQN